jgi:hypothetical protein
MRGIVKSSPRKAADRSGGVKMGKDGKDAERVTTTLSRSQKLQLDRLAEREGVKVAWLVRRAVERFLDQANGGPQLPFEFKSADNAKR